MLESHERILRRLIRRFGSFPTGTYSNRISNDANVRITYEECSGRVFNLDKTCAYLIRRVPIRRRTLANIRWCDRGISSADFCYVPQTFAFVNASENALDEIGIPNILFIIKEDITVRKHNILIKPLIGYECVYL